MDFLSIIEDKKRGRALSAEQIRMFADGAATGSVPDYQLSALLMAIRLNGMNAEETAHLTMAMAQSGNMLQPDVGGVPVDKHSTGGVGDTTTLVLAPLVAACGGKVLKMSGRGLGHTGGTVDKMEAIPGMRVTLPESEFVDIVRRIGCAVVGQSAELAPADKRLYALRDVTATVDSIPLIASSVLSKKFASGARAIVLDVKTGSGALMNTEEDSIRLAKAMVDIGTLAGRYVTAVVSGMQEPLGSHVGNALEVKEAIDVLAGRVDENHPLCYVAVYLGAHMLLGGGQAQTLEEAKAMLLSALREGRGLAKLKEMIRAQGGDDRVCDDVGLLPQAPCIVPLAAPEDGYLSATDCTALGRAAQLMGAGRIRKEDEIDPAVGFVMEKRIGDFVRKGENICTLHARSMESAKETGERILSALTFSAVPCGKARLLYDLVDCTGVHPL
ncbi:MAG: thymidine phosphorylase [Clostridiales bacterium]|nr:thymidine phosphorylase [Clostridiales bacterium]